MNILEMAKQEHPELLGIKKCEICNKQFYFTDCQIVNYYKKILRDEKMHYYCSRICCSKLQNRLLGNPFSRQEIIEKIKNKRKNDMDENGRNSYQRAIQKGLETKRADIDENGLDGCQRILIKNRRKCKELYGVENCFASDDPKLNGRATKEERYGDPNYVNHEKSMETNRKNHGGKHNWACDDPKLNGKATKEREHGDPHWSNRPKAEETTFIRHGKKYYPETEEFKNYMKQPEVQKQKQQKEYKTKQRNGTLSNHRSKPEIRCFESLKTKFQNIKHSYRDNEQYPFKCDIYVPSQDLFIECHFGWKHGGEPFDKNNTRHIELLDKWQLKTKDLTLTEKARESYRNAIYQWTDLDIRKLKTFQDNHLNYKIFYTEKEFNEWFNSLH